MGFINRGKLHIRERNECACARVSSSDVQPPRFINPIFKMDRFNKLYITCTLTQLKDYFGSSV